MGLFKSTPDHPSPLDALSVSLSSSSSSSSSSPIAWKRLRLSLSVCLSLLLLYAAATSHIRRRSESVLDPPESVQSVLSYLSLQSPGSILWAHDVRDEHTLSLSLSNSSIGGIEVDITRIHGRERVGGEGGDDALYFGQFLEKVMSSHSRKLVKLDFKDPRSVVPVLKQLQLYAEFGSIEQPFMLHADMLPSPGGPPVAFNPAEFLKVCNIMYPKGIVSIGWSTGSCGSFGKNNSQKKSQKKSLQSPYSPRLVNQTLAVLQDLGWKGDVTFAVQACFLEDSFEIWRQVLSQNSSYTLSVWNEEALSQRELNFIRSNLSASETFVDVRDVHSGISIPVYNSL